MKSRFFAFLVLAAATVASCSQDEGTDPVPAGREMNLSFTSDKPALDNDTRTVFENGGVLWNATGEKIRIAYADNGAFAPSQTFYATDAATVNPDRRQATFSFTGTIPTDPGSYTFHALYPSTASSMTKLDYGSEISAKILPTQTPSATSFDPAADVMVAASRDTYTTISDQAAIPLLYKRLAAHGCVTLTGLALEADEKINSVTFTAPAATKIAGSVYIDLFQKQVTQTTEAVNALTLAYNAAALDAQGAFDAWFCSLPFDIASGEEFKIEVATPRGTYTRTITARAEGIRFLQNRYNTLTVDMSSATFTPDPSAASIFNISFGTTSKNVTYSTNYNMGAIGTSASSLKYAFSATSEQIRWSNSISGYEGASGEAYWWATKQSTFTISGIDIADKRHFALSFGGGYAGSTIQASISVDGQFFYPISLDPASVTSTASLHTFHFSLASSYPTCSIRLENTGSTTVVIDDVQLKALDEAAPDAFTVNITPGLITTPDDGGTLTFAANNGTEGVAPEAQLIDYAWGGDNCSFSFEKDASATWFTATDNGNQIVILPQAYASTTEDRSGTITLKVSQNGTAVLSHTITVTQTKVGAVAETIEFIVSELGLGADGTSIDNKPIVKGDATLLFQKGSDSNPPKYYADGIRSYTKNTLTISSTKAITKIEFTFTTTKYSKISTANVGSYDSSTGVWTGTSNSIVFSNSAQTRITKIVVY